VFAWRSWPNNNNNNIQSTYCYNIALTITTEPRHRRLTSVWFACQYVFEGESSRIHPILADKRLSWTRGTEAAVCPSRRASLVVKEHFVGACGEVTCSSWRHARVHPCPPWIPSRRCSAQWTRQKGLEGRETERTLSGLALTAASGSASPPRNAQFSA
jgi:hypothetical protein